MDPNIFRKGDAPSCLVVDKTWDDIIDKPDFFDELANRILEMTSQAESLQPQFNPKTATFWQLKDAINKVLMVPLTDRNTHQSVQKKRTEGSVLVDAFWDEIIVTDNDWEKLKSAIAKAYDMRLRIEEHNPLTESDTLKKTKDVFNETTIMPLLGINLDE